MANHNQKLTFADRSLLAKCVFILLCGLAAVSGMVLAFPGPIRYAYPVMLLVTAVWNHYLAYHAKSTARMLADLQNLKDRKAHLEEHLARLEKLRQMVNDLDAAQKAQAQKEAALKAREASIRAEEEAARRRREEMERSAREQEQRSRSVMQQPAAQGAFPQPAPKPRPKPAPKPAAVQRRKVQTVSPRPASEAAHDTLPCRDHSTDPMLAQLLRRLSPTSVSTPKKNALDNCARTD